MGPRLFRRGDLALLACVEVAEAASMGPRLFRRGDTDELALRFIWRWLQWGHVFSDVETT